MGSPRSVLDPKRRKIIEARIIEGATVAELQRAIDGCRKSAWHMGENDRSSKYNSIELICRDRAHIERFADMVDNPVAKKPGEAGYWSEEETTGPIRGREEAL